MGDEAAAKRFDILKRQEIEGHKSPIPSEKISEASSKNEIPEVTVPAFNRTGAFESDDSRKTTPDRSSSSSGSEHDRNVEKRMEAVQQKPAALITSLFMGMKRQGLDRNLESKLGKLSTIISQNYDLINTTDIQEIKNELRSLANSKIDASKTQEFVEKWNKNLEYISTP